MKKNEMYMFGSKPWKVKVENIDRAVGTIWVSAEESNEFFTDDNGFIPFGLRYFKANFTLLNDSEKTAQI